MSWMPELENLIESLESSRVKEDFRLFLTSAPTDSIPSMILQNSVKMTFEMSGDVKQMMLNAYSQVTDADFSKKNGNIYKTLFFSLTLFHSLVIDRKRFGPIGWTNL